MSYGDLLTPNYYNLYCRDLDISGDLIIGGDMVLDELLVEGATGSVSTSTGAIRVVGGLGLGENLYMGGELHVEKDVKINGTTVSNSTSTGALTIAGGVGIGLNTYIGGDLYLKTSGYTPTAMNFYREATFMEALGGAVFSISLTGTFTRMNNTVFLCFDTINKASEGNFIIYTAAFIPTEFKPSGTRYCPSMVIDNNNFVSGYVEVGSNGVIQIYVVGATNGKFSGSGNAGILANTICYHV